MWYVSVKKPYEDVPALLEWLSESTLTLSNLARRRLPALFFKLLNWHHKVLSTAGNNTQVHVEQCMDGMVENKAEIC